MGSHSIPYTLEAHEDTHVAGGSDDIDSALAIAAMANLTNNKIWKGNAANRPVEVAPPAAGPTIATGSYTGDGSYPRQITVGFKCSMVVLFDSTSPAAVRCYVLIPNYSANFGGSDLTVNLYLHASDGFYLVDIANVAARVYYYWAISE